MNIPEVLYKYQSVSDKSIENLQNAQVWISFPSAFNDPFDCRIRADAADLSLEECQLLFDWFAQNHPAVDLRKMLGTEDPPNHPKFAEVFLQSCDKLFSDALRRYSHECGVCCFSEEFANILMWSHYADFHKGFCLGISTNAELFSKVKRVTYSPNIPKISPVPFFLHTDNADILNAMLWTKYETWSYEKEWRVAHRRGGTTFGYGADQLHSIYMGLEMSGDHKEQIRSIVKGHPVELYEMTRHHSAFELVPVHL